MHKIQVTIEYDTENGEPLLSALAIERTLMGAFSIVKISSCKVEYVHEETVEEDIF